VIQQVDNVTLEDLAERLDALTIAVAAPAQRWLSVSSAGSYSDLSTESIRRLISAGKLIAHRPVRGKILIDKVELDALIAGATKTPRVGRGRRKR
jgi:excisionase family DNA binding protein